MNYAGNQSEIETRIGLTFATHDSVALAGDLYLPKGSGPFPILVGIHGGGWVQGVRGALQYWGPWLASRGVALFSVSYRLAKTGQKTFPHAVQDVLAAVQSRSAATPRTGGSISERGGRPVRPIRRRQYRRARGAGRPQPGFCQWISSKTRSPSLSTEVKLFAGIYGCYDVLNMWNMYNMRHPGENNIEKFIGASPLDNRQLYFDASPLSYAVRANNKVAVHLSVGTEDDLVDRKANTDAFALALYQAGFFVRTTILQGAPHYWGGDPIDEPGSFTGFLAPRLIRFLQEKL